MVSRARALDDRAPSADLWPAIAAMVGPDGGAVVPIRSARRFSFSVPQLAAAAVLLVAGSGGAAWLLRVPPRAVVATAPAQPRQATGSPAATLTGWTRPELTAAAVATTRPWPICSRCFGKAVVASTAKPPFA